MSRGFSSCQIGLYTLAFKQFHSYQFCFASPSSTFIIHNIPLHDSAETYRAAGVCLPGSPIERQSYFLLVLVIWTICIPENLPDLHVILQNDSAFIRYNEKIKRNLHILGLANLNSWTFKPFPRVLLTPSILPPVRRLRLFSKTSSKFKHDSQISIHRKDPCKFWLMWSQAYILRETTAFQGFLLSPSERSV